MKSVALVALLLEAGSEGLLVLRLGLLVGLRAAALVGEDGALALEADRGHQALDLGGLRLSLGALLLGGDLATDDVLADVVGLAEVLCDEKSKYTEKKQQKGNTSTTTQHNTDMQRKGGSDRTVSTRFCQPGITARKNSSS